MKYIEDNEAIIDGLKTIPCDPLNADYDLIVNGRGEFGDDNYIAPTLGEVEAYVAPVIDPQIEINADARAYLDTTDWYVVRFVETAVDVPAEITAARQTARGAIV